MSICWGICLWRANGKPLSIGSPYAQWKGPMDDSIAVIQNSSCSVLNMDDACSLHPWMWWKNIVILLLVIVPKEKQNAWFALLGISRTRFQWVLDFTGACHIFYSNFYGQNLQVETTGAGRLSPWWLLLFVNSVVLLASSSGCLQLTLKQFAAQC